MGKRIQFVVRKTFMLWGLLSFLFFTFLCFPLISTAQIYEPEGLNMPGSWNGWTNPPSNNLVLANPNQAVGGKLEKITVGTTRWQTTFGVNENNADLQAGNYEWLFTSGPTSNSFGNKWASVNVEFNQLQSYIHNGSDNNTIELLDGNWYTMNWEDRGYVDTRAIFMVTSAEPVTFESVLQHPLADEVFVDTEVDIIATLSAAPSPEEIFYLRYTNDNWNTSQVIELSLDGTTGSAIIPGQADETRVQYYVFSTVIENISKDFDLQTLRFKNDDGNPFFYDVGEVPEPEKFEVTFTVTDQTESYQAIEFKGQMTEWANVPMIEGPDFVWTLTLEMEAGTYEWGLIENDGSEHGIWLLPGDNLQVVVGADGQISGDVSFTIEPPVPNYGISQEEENLPTLTYSLTATGNDITLKGDELEGSDLGTVFELFLRGASIKTWKEAGGDITAAQLHYKVWKTGEIEPADYEVIGVSWTANDHDDANLQTWAGFGDPVALTTSLVPGNYQLQVLFTISGTGVPGETENGPFRAEFELAEPSSAAEITAFTIEHQSGNAIINTSQATVNVRVQYGTDLTVLIPQITVSEGAQISPASEEAQDFSAPVAYTVTAEDGTAKEWTVTVEEAGIAWANLQYPSSGTIAPEAEFVVYARVFVDGLTGADATAESLQKLSAWIGYSETNAATTADFETGWTWVEASLAEYSENFGNNSEYTANIGTDLEEEGTYYFVSRFQLGEEGDFVYGGYENGFWDGTTQVSGELTVEIPQPNYGMQDDGGVNLPSLTYWYTGETEDIEEQGADFHEKDLGVIHDLYLKGASIKTWKAEGGDVTGTQLQYKVWKSSETEPGSWATREVQFTSGDGDGSQIWANFGDEINIVGDLSSGDYTLKVRFRVNGTGVPGKIEDGPYTMEFALDRLSSAADITAFVIEGAMGDAVINKEAATVDVTMPYDADVSALTPQITVSSGASISPASGVEQDFTHPVEYVVSAEDGTEKQWTAKATLAEKPEITWANLQHPASGTIQPESEFMVYARVFAENLTGADATAESLQKLPAWIGYSDSDAATSADFETGWTWVEATMDDYDAIFGNNSQFSADIGSGIATEGTLYYVSRFRYGTDDFVYGGFEGGFWNGADNVSGVLEVQPPAPEYGIRDDEGANLPRITFWHTGAENDIEQTGAQMEHADLGEVTAFYIKGVNIKTWKSGVGDVTDAWFHYKVWSADDAEPQDYHVIDIGWTSNDNAEETLQTWAEMEDEIALHDGLEVGDYHLKIKFSIAGTGVPGITENGPFTVAFAIEEEPVLHTLTLTASPEGAGVLTGEGDYEEGKVVDVAAVAEDGYEFVNWTDEGGLDISDQAAFAFTMPGADVTLTANFSAIPQTPYIVSITPVDDVVVAWGTSLEDAIAELAGETTITDSEGEQHSVALSWEIPAYDAQQADEYDATASFVLPEGVVQNPDNTLDLSVEAKVRVDEPTSVSEAETKSIRLYPNPASGVVNITSATAIHSLIIMDITGRVVHSSNVNDFQWQLNLDAYRPGIYLIRLHTASGSSVKRLQISR